MPVSSVIMVIKDVAVGAVVSVKAAVASGLLLPAASVAPAVIVPVGWSIGDVTGP